MENLKVITPDDLGTGIELNTSTNKIDVALKAKTYRIPQAAIPALMREQIMLLVTVQGATLTGVFVPKSVTGFGSTSWDAGSLQVFPKHLLPAGYTVSWVIADRDNNYRGRVWVHKNGNLYRTGGALGSTAYGLCGHATWVASDITKGIPSSWEEVSDVDAVIKAWETA